LTTRVIVLILRNREQDLSLFLLRQDYHSAVMLAMDLDQPFRILRILKDVSKLQETGSITGSNALDKVLSTLEDAKLQQLLLYLRDWNTHSKHAGIAHAVLHLILTHYNMDRVLGLKKARVIIEALIPYSERHYNHSLEMLRKSYLLDYTLECMTLV
jgi:U3 small nucleolar RNA-associated protein 13